MRRVSEKQKLKNIQKKIEREKMWNMFHEIWKKRPHKSEISGKWLGNEPKTIFFHHIVPKSTHPELALIEGNIILLTFEEHQNVEQNMYLYEEINNRRITLLHLYGKE